MTNKIIGIDYSLNSAAFCALGEGGINLGSLYRSTDSLEKLMNKKDKSIKELDGFKSLNLNIIEKETVSGEYHEVERQKIEGFIKRADTFFEMMKPHMTSDSYVFMEGISFGSTGNSLIDISMATALLRERIMSIIPSSNFYVFSPSSIKKFAVKGNAKKNELYETILLRNDIRLEEFQKILSENKSQWIKGSKDVVAPCNDLIDSIWISLFGENFLENPKKIVKK
jgi:hypothetical protein